MSGTVLHCVVLFSSNYFSVHVTYIDIIQVQVHVSLFFAVTHIIFSLKVVGWKLFNIIAVLQESYLLLMLHCLLFILGCI